MSHYETLGVSSDATPEEITASYRKAAMRHHPDRENGSDEQFKAVNTAYQVLSDPKKRADYDQYGDADDPVAKCIDSLFAQVLTEGQYGVNIIDACKKRVQVNLQQQRAMSKEMLASAEKLEKVKLRVKSKGDQNRWQSLVENHIAQIQARTEDANNAIALLSAVLERLADYSDDFTESTVTIKGHSIISFTCT